MKKRALALFMAVILALQLTGCNARKEEGNITASNRTQSSIKELFNNAKKDKKHTEKTTADEKELQDEELADKILEGEKTEEEEDVRYQDDYYEYVNQNLLSKIELSATDAHWDWFSELNAVVSSEMEDIIEELANDGKTYERGSSEQKIKDMYECVTNMENRNETGLGPLKPHMDSIRNASTIEEYVDALAQLSGEFGFSSIVGGYSIMQDKADSSEYAVYMMYADTLIGKEYIEGEK